MHRLVLEALGAGPLTVPQIAEAIGQPADEVVVLGHGDAPLPHGRRAPGRRR